MGIHAFDEVESTRKTRPVKQALLTKLRAKEYDAVVVYKLDRWARSSTELILETKELIDKGVGFISISDNSILQQFQEATFSDSSFQSRALLISERTKEGLKRAKSQEKAGRPKVADENKRRKVAMVHGSKQKKQQDENSGVFKSVEAI